MIAPDAPDAALCMAKNSKTNKNQQASGAKGGKRGKGELVLDLSDPADEAFDLVLNRGLSVLRAWKYTGEVVSLSE